MRMTRVHVEVPLGAGMRVTLPESAANHLVRVLRLGLGDACVLFNGDGCDYHARLVTVGKRDAQAEVERVTEPGNESPLRLVLLQALARGEKMDWILQKATELGVHAVVPANSERSEVRLDGARADKRLAHWRSVVSSACEQSGRAKVPAVSMPLALTALDGAVPADSRRVLLDPEATTPLAGIALDPGASVVVAIGPEGGWSANDLAALQAQGFERVSLGPRVLRTETAGLAAIVALQARYGDFSSDAH